MTANHAGFLKFIADMYLVDSLRLWEPFYESFAAYARIRWGFSRQYASYLVQAAPTCKALSTMVDVPQPTNERQVRSLHGLEPEQKRDLWQQVCDATPGDEPPSSRAVDGMAARYKARLAREKELKADKRRALRKEADGQTLVRQRKAVEWFQKVAQAVRKRAGRLGNARAAGLMLRAAEVMEEGLRGL
jgi:hypothetical protein